MPNDTSTSRMNKPILQIALVVAGALAFALSTNAKLDPTNEMASQTRWVVNTINARHYLRGTMEQLDGAEMVEAYIQRLRDLENLALEYPGVTKSYAIQAGRELRVMVESDQVSDDQADQLSFDISQRIMNEMTYPGQVKITVIRERRAVSIAR